MKKELTRIITAKITIIEDADKAKDKEMTMKNLSQELQSKMNADNVVVTKIQDFISDKKK